MKTRKLLRAQKAWVQVDKKFTDILAWTGAKTGATDACYIVPVHEYERHDALRKAVLVLLEHEACIRNALNIDGCELALAALSALADEMEHEA